MNAEHVGDRVRAYLDHLKNRGEIVGYLETAIKHVIKFKLTDTENKELIILILSNTIDVITPMGQGPSKVRSKVRAFLMEWLKSGDNPILMPDISEFN
jgi:hypothetical protein